MLTDAESNAESELKMELGRGPNLSSANKSGEGKFSLTKW